MDSRVTLVFEQDGAGWTESWFRSGDATVEDSADRGRILAEARQDLCAKNCQITSIRSSDTDILGDSAIETVNGVWGKATLSIKADPPFSGLLVRTESGALYRKMTNLRGLPQSLLVEKPETSSVWGQWLNRFNAWSLLLTASGSGWMLRVRTKATPVNTFEVSNVFPDPTNANRVILTVPGHTFADGSKIRLNGLKFNKKGVKLGGVFQVFNKNVSGFTIFAPNPAALYMGFGTARPVGMSFVPITSNRIMRASSRKVGRVFGGFRGRRSTKRT